ncbi:fungal-specific transcription factor domain-containing protein [Mycena galericulata]|nr:fungal-specific transcription factor domain-containing protein [Mycena galericulata]
MSSNDEEYADLEEGAAQRAHRACDVCRKRKSWSHFWPPISRIFICFKVVVPGGKCLTCLSANLECTFKDPARKRITQSRYVADLVARLGHAESLVGQLRAEVVKLNAELDTERLKNANHSSPSSSSDSYSQSTESDIDAQDRHSGATLHILRTALHTLSAPPAPHAEDIESADLASKAGVMPSSCSPLQLDALIMNPTPRFTGKSSTTVLIKATLDLKADIRRDEQRAASESRGFSENGQGINPMWCVFGSGQQGSANGWKAENGGGHTEGADGRDEGDLLASKRLEYWLFQPWKNPPIHMGAYSFPPPDLAAQLIDLYFTRAHLYLPLLHRQSFERNVEMGVHQWDNSFAAIVLLVCAIGSRWSNDPRVLSSGKTSPHIECGWEWFNQVPPAGKHVFGQATLYDLQYYCVGVHALIMSPFVVGSHASLKLAVHFLLGSSASQASWMLVGIGLRLAQDAGAHRRPSPVQAPSVERELWKRAFWVLLYMDSYVSGLMGRTCLIQYEDFDIDPPIECDDEYWEHPTHPFQQPSGIPSRIVFFNTLLRLNHILAFCLKILYSLSKARSMLAIDPDGEEQFVAELDSALNRWRDQVPDHLSWDPARADPVFFDQSVALNCAYYTLQILIHRSFIPTLHKAAPTRLPSLAVCTNAARACANMLDLQRQRKGSEAVNFNMSAAFSSAVLLLLNIWSGKRAGLVRGVSNEIENLNKCIEVIRLCEDRWQNAGILVDVITELASVGQLPVQLSAPFRNEVVQQQHTMTTDVTQPMSADDMLRIMLKEPYLQPTSDFTDPRQVYIEGVMPDGGLGVPPVDSVFTEGIAWRSPEPSFSSGIDASGEMNDAMSMVDSDAISMWLNAAPSGFG